MTWFQWDAIKRTLAWIGIVALVVSASVGFGWQLAQLRASSAVVASTQRADSLRLALQVARATVRVDSVNVDREVTRWRVKRDSFRDTVRDTLRDTITRIINAADAAITACSDALGRCGSALAIAERSVAAERDAHKVTTQSLAITTGALERAQSRTWPHRLQGFAAGVLTCGGAVYGVQALRPP